MEKNWHVLKPNMDTVYEIANLLHINPVVATLLVNRQIEDVANADRFLNPSIQHIRPPFAIKDMDRATSRIADAVLNHERILFFGDYDVDGVTAIVGLFQFFNDISADVTYYIPHRTKEGYGLKPQHIHNYMVKNSIDLIITADCGSSSHEAALAAKDAGMDLIITDHHKISSDLPSAYAVINPNRHDCFAGFEHLSGVGVAFCLLICLRKHLRDLGFWKNRTQPNLTHFCDLVALGTVADMVPMKDENRIFSKIGLNIMKSGHRKGIRALCEASGTDIQTIDTEDIAFRLAPRLNAAGRMDHAEIAITLLTATDSKIAENAAVQLNKLNQKRRRIEKLILQQIDAYLHNHPHITEKLALVLSHDHWHEGVLGIVASKLVEKYCRPIVLISVKKGIGKGSARGLPGINLYQALRECQDDLDQFGGHAMAGGLQIKAEKIDQFRKHFHQAIVNASDNTKFTPQLVIDCHLDLNQVNPAFLDGLDCLKPHGPENPPPMFLAKDIRVIDSKIVGKIHRRMTLCQSSVTSSNFFKAIQFNIDPETPPAGRFERIAFRPTWNHWNGRKSIQLIIEEARES
jgi:single-stranded-DNA-specific exonuclease